MITASHNPKDDNGLKVYWGNACQIIPPHDSGIAAAIEANLQLWQLPDAVLQASAVLLSTQCQCQVFLQPMLSGLPIGPLLPTHPHTAAPIDITGPLQPPARVGPSGRGV